MNSTDIVDKTDQGTQEIKTRSRKLPQRLRTMLIMIDGSQTAARLQQAAATLGVPPDFLDSLEQQGLIVAHPAAASASAAAAAARRANLPEVERFRAAQKFMNDTVVDALGFRAFFFTLKLEKCFTREDLGALLDDYAKAITKGSGADTARVLVARSRELLS